jgi:hypothetical protein
VFKKKRGKKVHGSKQRKTAKLLSLSEVIDLMDLNWITAILDYELGFRYHVSLDTKHFDSDEMVGQ